MGLLRLEAEDAEAEAIRVEVEFGEGDALLHRRGFSRHGFHYV